MTSPWLLLLLWCLQCSVLGVNSNNTQYSTLSVIPNKIQDTRLSDNQNKTQHSTLSVNQNKTQGSNISVVYNKTQDSRFSADSNEIQDSNSSVNSDSIQDSNLSDDYNKTQYSRLSNNFNKIQDSTLSDDFNKIQDSRLSVHNNGLVHNNRLQLSALISTPCTKFTYVFRVHTNYVMFAGTDDAIYLQVRGSFTPNASSGGDTPPAWAPSYIELDSPVRDDNEYDRMDRHGPYKWCGESMSPHELVVWKATDTSNGWNVLKIVMEIHEPGQPTNYIFTFWGSLWLDNELSSCMKAVLGKLSHLSRYECLNGGGRCGLAWWWVVVVVLVVVLR